MESLCVLEIINAETSVPWNISSTAKAAKFPKYKCLDEWYSTVFQARTHTNMHTPTHAHTLPLNNVASAADQNNLGPKKIHADTKQFSQ
jgi:hypothetical protein